MVEQVFCEHDLDISIMRITLILGGASEVRMGRFGG